LSVILILGDVIQTPHLDVIFLCETLVNTYCIEEIKNLIGFNSCPVVDVNDKSEGLSLFWKHPFQRHLLNFSPNFVTVEVHKNSFRFPS